jgi:glycosyltransferase involved in cell wall biosynthesis
MRRLLRPLRRFALAARPAARWPGIIAARPPSGAPSLFYGHERIPLLGEPVHGGMVKFQALNERFPNRPRAFNLVYLGSSALPSDATMIMLVAGMRGIPLLWNQNGVAYPAWAGPRWERRNERIGRGLAAAAHVVYQSAFCKLSADKFVREPAGSWEIVHNPVDTRRFTPAERRPAELTLLLGGNQYQDYRFEIAVRTLALVLRERPARLIVTGRLSWSAADDPQRAPREAAALIEQLGVGDHVEIIGTYSQLEAPDIMRRGSLLLHTKVMDPCPTIVLEALASGLPVVYSESGGVPELVGADAGIPVPTALDWDVDVPPPPEAFAAAVLALAEDLEPRAEAARERAVSQFDLQQWLARHAVLFDLFHRP